MSYLTDPNELDPEMVKFFQENVLFGHALDVERYIDNPFVQIVDGEAVPWFGLGIDGNPNVYPHGIPFDDVVDKLFSWDALKVPTFGRVPTDDMGNMSGMNEDGTFYRDQPLDTYAVIRSDTGAELCNGVSDGYTVHQYRDKLLDVPAAIIEASAGELDINTAGLLRRGGRDGVAAFVDIAMPEYVVTEDGFAFKTTLEAVSSHDQKWPTTFLMPSMIACCMNSVTANLANSVRKIKVRHTKNSELKIAEARDVLGIVFKQTEADKEFFEKLARWEVSKDAYKQTLDIIEPMPEPEMDKGKVKNQRTITNAETRRGDITRLYVRDPRAATWNGTALGVLQAFNTWDQHERQGVSNPFERRITSTVSGDTAKMDAGVLNVLAEVTDYDLEKLLTAAVPA